MVDGPAGVLNRVAVAPVRGTAPGPDLALILLPAMVALIVMESALK